MGFSVSSGSSNGDAIDPGNALLAGAGDVLYFNDFLDSITSGATTAAAGPRGYANGAGALCASSNSSPTAIDSANHPGSVYMATGTTSGGYLSLSNAYTGGASALFGMRLGSKAITYETEVYIETLSDGTQSYVLKAGLDAAIGAVDAANCVDFVYTSQGYPTGSTAATYWQTNTCAASSRTWNASHTPVTVATGWTKLKIVINSAGSEALFYVNGALVATHTVNIPTATDLGWKIEVLKHAGTTSRIFAVDWIKISGTR